MYDGKIRNISLVKKFAWIKNRKKMTYWKESQKYYKVKEEREVEDKVEERRSNDNGEGGEIEDEKYRTHWTMKTKKKKQKTT